MYRNLLTLAVALPALWLSIQVFGWIVSGDIALGGKLIRRENGAGKFWASITLLGLICCALFGVALAILIGALIRL